MMAVIFNLCSPRFWMFTSEQWRNILFLWNLNARAGDEPTITDFTSRKLQAGSFNHCTSDPPDSFECLIVRCSILHPEYTDKKHCHNDVLMLAALAQHWMNGSSLLCLPRIQQTRSIDSMLAQCWATVCDAVPTLSQQSINISCLLGSRRSVKAAHLPGRLLFIRSITGWTIARRGHPCSTYLTTLSWPPEMPCPWIRARMPSVAT